MAVRSVESRCPICSGARAAAFEARVLDRYAVTYLYCSGCGLLQTEPPYWEKEAYAEPIARADTGILARNRGSAARLSSLLYFGFDAGGRFLDVSGGYGLLTRMMRDIGFDYFWEDPHAENLFARGFEWSARDDTPEAVSAMEVLEHVHDPLAFLRDVVTRTGTDSVILTTELFCGEPPAPDAWWYYAFETGQHVSFYQLRTLEALAQELSMRVYSSHGLHLLTRRRISARLHAISASRAALALSAWVRLRMTSRTQSDHERLMDRH